MSTPITDSDIKSFIEKVETNCTDEEIKKAFVDFANEALNNASKAAALEQFIANFATEDGDIDPELYEVPAYSIGDFYNDFVGQGAELDPAGNGVVGSDGE